MPAALSIRVGRDHFPLTSRADRPHGRLAGARFEELDGTVGHRDITAARMEAAQAVHSFAVPVAVPRARPAVGKQGVRWLQGVAQAVTEHALAPVRPDVAHVLVAVTGRGLVGTGAIVEPP